jgi:long-subunit fatty acid transport protein
MRRALISMTIAAATLVPAALLAGGLEVPDNGTRAVGRAGAYAAAVAEPMAVYYNPAALSLLDGFALTLNANLWFYDASFQRDPFTVELIPGLQTTIPFERAHNGAPFFPAPMLFASYDFGLQDWGFGLGVYGPSAIGRRDFGGPDLAELAEIQARDANPRDWGHGYLTESTDILLIFYSLAAAYDFGPVQLGLTLQLAHMMLEFTNGADGGGVLDALSNADEAPSLYTRARMEASGLAPTGIVAVRVQPIRPLTFALSYRPRVALEGDGDLFVTFPVALDGDVFLTDTAATLSLKLPDIFRFGLRWAFFDGDREVADLELDLVYEAWSQLESFEVDVKGDLQIGFLGQTRDIRPIEIPKGYDDTLSVRLGGDVRITNEFLVRAGAFYEGAANGRFFDQGTTRPRFANLDFTPFRRLGLSLGASYELEAPALPEGHALSFDLAYMHVFSQDLRVTDGAINILFPLWLCDDPQTDSDRSACQTRTSSPVHPVNEGSYSVAYDVLSVGLTYRYR